MLCFWNVRNPGLVFYLIIDTFSGKIICINLKIISKLAWVGSRLDMQFYLSHLLCQVRMESDVQIGLEMIHPCLCLNFVAIIPWQNVKIWSINIRSRDLRSGRRTCLWQVGSIDRAYGYLPNIFIFYTGYFSPNLGRVQPRWGSFPGKTRRWNT